MFNTAICMINVRVVNYNVKLSNKKWTIQKQDKPNAGKYKHLQTCNKRMLDTCLFWNSTTFQLFAYIITQKSSH